MSYRIIHAVGRSTLTATEGFVLIMLANCAAKEGDAVRVKNDRLMQLCNLSDKGVRNAIAALKARGVVVEVARHANNVAEYRIDVEAIAPPPSADAPARGAEEGTPAPRAEPLRHDVPGTPAPRAEPLRHDVPGTPAPRAEPLRHDVPGTPAPRAEPYREDSPDLYPDLSSRPLSRERGEEARAGAPPGEGEADPHPAPGDDPATARLLAAVLAAVREVPAWRSLGEADLPDLPFVRRQIGLATEAGADEARLLDAIAGFGAHYRRCGGRGSPIADLASWLTKRRAEWAREREAIDRRASNARRDEIFEGAARRRNAPDPPAGAERPDRPERPARLLPRRQGFVLAGGEIREKFEGDDLPGRVHGTMEGAREALKALKGLAA